MKLSQIKQVLGERGIQLTKSLGQNFLHDANQLRRIVELAELTPADRVLEVGPGLGPLTERLLETGVEVLAIEKDARLVQVLRDRFRSVLTSEHPPAVPKSHQASSSSTSQLTLLHEDALEWLQLQPRAWAGWKVVSNLPYSVASPILVELALAAIPSARIVATLQLEVVRRLIAQAGSPDYGVLTLLVQLQFEPVAWFKIPAGCFFPEPEIDSGCVCLARRAQPLLDSELIPIFSRIVKRSFSQRRKMMFKLLKADWPTQTLEAALVEASIPPQARAEALSLEQFVRLTLRLASHSNA